MNELVSVIITTHNRLSLLRRAIDSVKKQTYKNIECLVLDDASDDGTESYCRNRKDFQYIRISPEDSRGGNHARNIGIKASKGKYLAFLDDDDYWLPTKIEKQVELMVRKHYVLCSCGRCIEKINKDKSVTTKEDRFGRFFPEDMSKVILNGVCTTTSLIMVRKDEMIAIGLFDERLRYWQEYEMCIRLSQRGKFGYVDDALAVYRLDLSDNQRLTNKYEGWSETVNYILHKHDNRFSSMSFKDFLRFQQFVSREACIRQNITSEGNRSIVYNARVAAICNALLSCPTPPKMKSYLLLIYYSHKLLPLWQKRNVYIA